MGDYRAKLARQVGDDLHGEELRAALKGGARGHAHRAILGAAGGTALGAAGMVAGTQIGERVTQGATDQAAAAGLDTARASQLALGLTDRRLLVWSLGIAGRPKELLGELPLDQLESVTLGTATLFGQTMPEVVVRARAGGELGVQVGKVARRGAEAFVAACNRRG